MILDTENVLPVGQVADLPSANTFWVAPGNSVLDHRISLHDRRIAQLEATVQAQAAELLALRMLIMNLTTVLRLHEGDGR